MKIIAKSDYHFWTVGKTYDVITTEEGNIDGEIWYTVFDDKGERTDLSSIRNTEDFELVV